MSTTESQRCLECGHERPPGVPAGLCPVCALPAQTEPAALAAVKVEPGDIIGRYKLLEKIGEGGCGIVYMAEQEEPVRRRVALKVIKPGMDTREVIARFEAERQALALMEHPHIAKIFDGGVTGGPHPQPLSHPMGEGGHRPGEGSSSLTPRSSLLTSPTRPYFVMELVRGLRITDYCDQKNLSTRQRLDLFMQVCQAVQHAHQKGIIHRDLKPSNILVTVNDGVPVPKVIDFGIAKATGPALTDKTFFTKFQQLIGTPAYMSPEQAEMTSVDIDTRSDIYSLGVLLYELLTGRTPFDTQELLRAGMEAMLRTIREQEPVRPSARLSTLTSIEQTTVALQRQTDAPKLISLVRGDLDWIVMKCLEKDCTRRYETANALASDVHRHLTNEPVLARPPTTAYRVQKFVRRNKGLAAASAAIAFVLLLGVLISTWQWREAVNARNFADSKASAEIAANRTANQQRERAEEAATQLELQTAEHFFASDEAATGVAYLARLLRHQPTNRVAAERLVSALSQRRFLLPVGEPIEHEGGMNSSDWDEALNASCRFSSDGLRVLLVQKTGAFVFDASTGRSLSNPVRYQAGSVGGSNGSSRSSATVKFSPDGKWFLAASREPGELNGLRAWNCAGSNAVPIGLIMSHGARVTSFDFSPDGARVITGYSNGEAQLWSVGDWKRIGDPLRHTGSPVAVRFALNGDRVFFEPPAGRRVTNQWDFGVTPPVRVPMTWSQWSDMPPDLLLRQIGFGWSYGRDAHGTLKDELASSLCAAASADGQRVVTSKYGQSMLWDLSTGGLIGEPIRHKSFPTGPEFSPDCQSFVLGLTDGSARIYDANTGYALSEPVFHRARVEIVRFSPDGRRILTVSADKTARVWEAVNRSDPSVALEAPNLSAPYSQSSAHSSFSAQFSPDARRLITSSGELNAWDSHSGALVTQSHETNDFSVSISPDGRLLLLCREEEWGVRDATTFQPMFAPSRGGTNRQAVFSADGAEVIVRKAGGVVTRWEARTGQKLGEQFTRPPWTVQPTGLSKLSPHGEWLVIVPQPPDTAVEIWDTKSGRRVGQPLPHDVSPRADFTEDGKWLVTITWRGTNSVRVWDVESGRLAHGPFDHSTRIGCAEISSDGQWLVIGSDDKTARLWNLRTGEPVVRPLEHDSSVRSAQFSPDGLRVVTTSDIHGLVRIWDTATGYPISEPLKANYAFASFSPDGRLLRVHSPDTAPCLQDVFRPTLPVPQWLPPLAEVIAGKSVDASGVIELAPKASLEAIGRELTTGQSSDFYSKWGEWLLDDSPNRPVIFQGSLTSSEYADRILKRVKTGDGVVVANGIAIIPGSARAALRLSPTNLVALARLTEKYRSDSRDSTQAVAGARFYASRAVSVAPNDVESWELYADALRANSDTNENFAEIDRLIRKHAGHPGPWLVKGYLAMRPPEFVIERRADSARFGTHKEQPQMALSSFSEGIKLVLANTNDFHSFLKTLYVARGRVLLTRMNNIAKAAVDNLAAYGFSARDPSLSTNSVDLSAFYNAPLAGARIGRATLQGVEFDLRARIQLADRSLDDDHWGIHGSKLGAYRIPVPRRCKTVHFLHAVNGVETNGAKVASYVVSYFTPMKQVSETRFTSGPQLRESIPVVYGHDLSSWKIEPGETGSVTRGSIAWTGTDTNGSTLRLFKTTWTNPHPETQILSFDFVAEPMTKAAPFLVAITTE